jgi:hypothetical protein
MKKHFLLSLAMGFALSVGNLSAKSLVLTLSDGTLVYYLLGGTVSPMMKFIDGGFTVNADAYEFSGIKNFYISSTDDPTGVTSVAAVGGKPVFDGSLLRVATAGTEVAVYTADGKRVAAPVSRAGDFTTVDMSGLGRGVYLVRIGGASMKVLKK